MKKLSTSIDRFCAKHPNFGIRNLMLFIVIGNIIVFLFSMMDKSGYFLSYLLFNPQLILKGQVWRLLTFVFVPESTNLIMLAITLYFYYFIGNTLERQWGTAKFTLYYICGIICTVVYGMIVGLLGNVGYFAMGSSYINLSMFFVFATFFPESRVLLFFFIPIKIKWLAYLNAAYFALGVISYLMVGNVLLALVPIIAILNYFIFCGDMLLDSISSLRRRSNRRRNSNVVDFKKAAKQAYSETQIKGYTRKCSVCGRTDTDYPDLEFRYCSRCEGYHCFCEDHIGNHIHFTE
ncbi:MAG: rhomboid family intramembrane serine protease [Oscillospiraceae bacterium]|nr:rhomboid family intramembrane serine protease [Oscillospiraceae bacterium]